MTGSRAGGLALLPAAPRIAFAGTPPFAAVALAALLAAGKEVCLVLSQPDRQAGRGLQLRPSAVKRLALEHGLPVLTPSSLRPERGGPPAAAALERLRAAAPDVLVVAAYGMLLPAPVLDLPRGLQLAGDRLTAINIHASLLPRWRGAAPIARAIEAGDTRTGITIMQMDAGLDTGPILLSEAMDIGPADTAATLTERLAALGARLLVDTLEAVAAGRICPRAQPAEGVLYAQKIVKHEAWLDWTQPADVLAARVRAFDPFPGTCSSLEGHVVKVWRAQVIAADRCDEDAGGMAPGTVCSAGPAGIVVACGAAGGASATRLCLTQLQRPGGRRLEAREFLAASAVRIGARWNTPVAAAAAA